MQELAKNFYCYEEQKAHAFFMVKAYEEYIHSKNDIKEGTSVKIEGKVIQQRNQNTIYGMLTINSIITDNGTICERAGKIPTTEDENGNTRTIFYSKVKGMYHGCVTLDRATKKPKKNVEYINL